LSGEATAPKKSEAELRKQAEDALWATKAIIRLDKEKLIQVGTGEKKNVPVEAAEKLVRMRAAMLTLDSDFLQAIDDEAKNRVMCSQITGRKPWE
jgi:hypothetical protein